MMIGTATPGGRGPAPTTQATPIAATSATNSRIAGRTGITAVAAADVPGPREGEDGGADRLHELYSYRFGQIPRPKINFPDFERNPWPSTRKPKPLSSSWTAPS